MKIAEALAERAELNKKIKAVDARAKASARWVEGEEPAESAEVLLAELNGLIDSRAELIARINMSNAATELSPGMTITQAIAERARLSALAKAVRELAVAASPGQDPYYRGRRRAELAERTSLSVTALHADADRFAVEHRKLDNLIQQANWEHDLI